MAATLLQYIPADVLPQSYGTPPPKPRTRGLTRALIRTRGGDRPDDEIPCPNYPGHDNVEEYDEAQCKESGVYYK